MSVFQGVQALKVVSRRKRARRLTDLQAVGRLKETCKLAVRDLVTCLHLEAVMEAGNQVVMSQEYDLVDEFGGVYRTLHFSLMASLSVTLSKLFEEPRPRINDRSTKIHYYNVSDKASLPILVHLLRQRRCQNFLLSAARGWSPPFVDMADFWENEVSTAIRSSLSAYGSFRQSATKRQAVVKLREIRNHAFAHSLRRAKTSDYPKYNELFLLCRVAETILGPAQFAIDAHRVDYRDEHTSPYNQMGRTFWERALAESNRGALMPKLMPAEVERALAIVLGYRNRPNPVELYDAIREVLEREQAAEQKECERWKSPS